MGSSHGMLVDQPSHERIIAWWKFCNTTRVNPHEGSLQTKKVLKKSAKLQCGCWLVSLPWSPHLETWSKNPPNLTNVAALKKGTSPFQKPKPCNVFDAKNKRLNFRTIRNYQKDLKQESRETPPFQSNSPSQDRHSTKSLPLTVFPRSQKNKMETKNTAHHDDTAVPGQVFGSNSGEADGWCYFNDGPMTYFGSCEAHVSHEKKKLITFHWILVG